MYKTKRIIIMLVALVIGISSCLLVGNKVSNPEFYSKNIESLEEVRNEALKITAGTTTTALVVAGLGIGDSTTPLANKLMDVAGYMVIVCTAIIAEKYIMVLSGSLVFRLLIPLACLLIVIGCIIKNQDNRERINIIAAKVIIVGLLLWALIPASIGVSNLVDKSYNGIVSITQEEEHSEQANEAENGDKLSIFEKTANNVKDLAKNIKDNGVKAAAGDALSDAKESAKDKINEAKSILNDAIEKVALLIVRTCVIPIGALLVGLWMIKTMFSIPIGPINLPKASKLMGKRDVKAETEIIDK